jgi:hypothetical protein
MQDFTLTSKTSNGALTSETTNGARAPWWPFLKTIQKWHFNVSKELKEKKSRCR